MASSYSSLPGTWRYRVFTSFHGPDVRKTFLSHLRKQFSYNGITMFDDQGIERSQTIAPSITEAIRESRILIVVLSKNYASSSWCLNELVEILECKEAMGQIVMTVFYGVEPSDVMKQTGDFGIAFGETCARKTEEEKQRWSEALNDVANIAGEHFLNWDNEAKMIEKIARDVSNKLNVTPSWDFDGMVGLEAHLIEMESLLDLDYDGVKIVAIYGPAGIGKTTIARALQSLISHMFQLTCFMDNLRGSYNSGLDEYGLKLHLQEQFLSKVLNQNGMRVCHLGAIKERLCDMKVLIILDDVNDVKQLEALANEATWFGPGSRIIVTTENKELLQRHCIRNMYNVGFPSDEEALKILCGYAFRQSSPRRVFEKLAIEVIELCGNLPLGLRVVGSSLCGKNEDEWKYVIHRLETIIDRDIEDVLRVGYESLDEKEQTLFLHIAVFFNYKDGDLVKAMLANNNWDIEHGLKILENKSLIYVSTKREIVMHNLLQQVGRQAIHRQEPWKRQILMDAQEICDVLENDTGSGVVSGISFDISGINEVVISNRALRRMRNLQFLSVYKTRYDENDRVHIPKEMEFPPRLRLLHWEAYPSKCLPLRFCVQNLVELNMHYSQLEKLWEGTQVLPNLKKMDLLCSIHLKELPDLSNATNLERLDLTLCLGLVELPSSIGNLHKLEELVMDYCKSLEVIPTGINLASLERISMVGCSRLKTFPDFSTNIKGIDLNSTAIEEVPSSFRHWSQVSYINLVGWLDLSNTDIEKIPDCIKSFHWLQCLYLFGCKKLVSLPELPSSLSLLLAKNCESLERVTFPLNTPNAQLIFTNCFKLDGESRRIIIQRSFIRGFTCLPGRVMPSEFNHRARGHSLNIRLSSPSSAFKACLMVLPNKIQHTREHRSVHLRFRITGERYFYKKIVSLYHTNEATGIRMEHLCIFHGDMPEVSNEALFEFHIRSDNPLETYEIIECGARILTNELEGSSDSEDYDDSNYEFELYEMLEDSKDNSDHIADRLISYDSESDNVEEKNKCIDCWSWLEIFLDLSSIVSNIGSLCWRRKRQIPEKSCSSQIQQ